MPVRPFRFDDLPAVAALHRHVGWPMRSETGWRWLASAPGQDETGAPLGFVLTDDDDRPTAFLGNMIRRFRRGDQVLHGATGHSIIVPPQARGGSRALIETFMAQPGLFARYTFNANARSAPLYARHGLTPWPVETAGTKLSWVVDPCACLTAKAWRWAVTRSPLLARHVGERLLNRRIARPKPVSWPDGVAPVADFGDASNYAAFWTALVAEGRLLADRGPEVLRWLFADPDAPRPPLALAFRRDGRITGFALAVLAKGDIVQAPTLEILDLQALEGEPNAIPALARALIAAARPLGAAKVRLQTVSPLLLDRLGAVAQGARREGGWGHCHARFEGGPPDDWSPTPFDGDYPICLRPAPKRI